VRERACAFFSRSACFSRILKKISRGLILEVVGPWILQKKKKKKTLVAIHDDSRHGWSIVAFQAAHVVQK
jgi:hypothetical protein